MKKLLLILLCLPMIGFGQPTVNIPDANFKAYLVGNTAINTNGDTEIQVSEATAFNGIIYCNSLNISDLTGIEYFTALTELYCNNNQLTTLDLSNNTSLDILESTWNQLTSLDVSSNTDLTVLVCGRNLLTSLNVSQNTALIYLLCEDNQLTILDVSSNTVLNTLQCEENQLTSLDVSQNTALSDLYCWNNELTSLVLSQNVWRLACSNNQLTSLDVINNTHLTFLNFSNNQLTSLDLSSNTDLNYLDCHENQLTSLDLRNGNNNLLDTNFYCTNNPNLSCINVDNASWSSANWTDIDPQHYFSNNCPPPSAIQDHSTNKELLKVTDILGRETKQTNQPLFYIYDDGTVKQKIIIE